MEHLGRQPELPKRELTMTISKLPFDWFFTIKYSPTAPYNLSEPEINKLLTAIGHTGRSSWLAARSLGKTLPRGGSNVRHVRVVTDVCHSNGTAGSVNSRAWPLPVEEREKERLSRTLSRLKAGYDRASNQASA